MLLETRQFSQWNNRLSDKHKNVCFFLHKGALTGISFVILLAYGYLEPGSYGFLCIPICGGNYKGKEDLREP